MYKDKMFRQIDGVTMGSPLGPSLANFFLAHIECKLFENEISCKPRLYMRYVDDIFAVFSENCNFKDFFDLLNSQHNSLSFTYEEGTDVLPFLDTVVQLTGINFETFVYRKQTNTDLILNNKAVCPDKWKTGLILCFLNRAWKICSSYVLFFFKGRKM